MRITTLIAALVLSASAHAWETPQQAVSEFLKFELGGGRLQAWPIEKYLSVGPDYDEPGWDLVHLIQEAAVLTTSCAKDTCATKVKFLFVPTAPLKLNQVVSHPDGGSEVIEYTTVRKDGSWFLKSSNGIPKVSYAEFQRRFPNGL